MLLDHASESTSQNLHKQAGGQGHDNGSAITGTEVVTRRRDHRPSSPVMDKLQAGLGLAMAGIMDLLERRKDLWLPMSASPTAGIFARHYKEYGWLPHTSMHMPDIPGVPKEIAGRLYRALEESCTSCESSLIALSGVWTAPSSHTCQENESRGAWQSLQKTLFRLT